MGLTSAFTAIKALSWFSKVSGVVSFIPIVGGPLGAIFGFVAALVQAVLKLLTNALKGITSISSNPKEMCAVIVLVMFVGALFFHWGVKYSGHLVREARIDLKEAKTQTANLISDLEMKDAEDSALAEAATDAAKAAEDLERQKIASEERAHELEIKAGVPPLTLLDSPPSVAVADSPPVAGVRAVEAGAAANKVRRKKPEPSVFETVIDSVGSAFDASKW